MKINRRYIQAGATALALSVVVAGTALAQPSRNPERPAGASDAADVEHDDDDEQDPELNGSITFTDDGSLSESEEAEQLAQLEGLISEADAIAAATADGGTADHAELENENGTVVYEVEVTLDDNTVEEVLVDAGNGNVLYREVEDDEVEDEVEDEADEETEEDQDLDASQP